MTIIVVGYNSERWLERCLSTLSTASSTKLQLCFVDNLNNPTFKSLDLAAFDVEVLDTEKPLGFADANNFGIQHTGFESDYTVFLNQDTVSTPRWIDQCVSCFIAADRLGVLSPGLCTYDLSGWEPNLLACIRESGMAPEVLSATSGLLVSLRQVTAAAMMIRTDVLAEVGPFDPIFGSYYEDYDLCRRVRRAGYSIGVFPTAKVGHFSSSVISTPEAQRRRSRILIRNRLIHAVRNTPDSRLRVLINHVLWGLPVNLVRGVLRTDSSQSVTATLGAHWDILNIIHRLISRSHDENRWKQFCEDECNRSAAADPGRIGEPGKQIFSDFRPEGLK